MSTLTGKEQEYCLEQLAHWLDGGILLSDPLAIYRHDDGHLSCCRYAGVAPIAADGSDEIIWIWDAGDYDPCGDHAERAERRYRPDTPEYEAACNRSVLRHARWMLWEAQTKPQPATTQTREEGHKMSTRTQTIREFFLEHTGQEPTIREVMEVRDGYRYGGEYASIEPVADDYVEKHLPDLYDQRVEVREVDEQASIGWGSYAGEGEDGDIVVVDNPSETLILVCCDSQDALAVQQEYGDTRTYYQVGTRYVVLDPDCAPGQECGLWQDRTGTWHCGKEYLCTENDWRVWQADQQDEDNTRHDPDDIRDEDEIYREDTYRVGKWYFAPGTWEGAAYSMPYDSWEQAVTAVIDFSLECDEWEDWEREQVREECEDGTTP